MAKEIEEQPLTLKNGIKEYIDTTNNDIKYLQYSLEKMKYLQ